MAFDAPNVQSKMYYTKDNHYWRCSQDAGSFLHIWWNCRVIMPFWEMIMKEIR